MADHKEQVKPLAPASLYVFRSDEEANNNNNNKNNINKTFYDDRRTKSCIKCCGCALAILVIAAVTLIILAFTVFHVKPPTVKMTSIAVDSIPTFANGTIRTDDNATLLVGVSVQNPNAASFRFVNTTTTVFYGGEAVGEGRSEAGVARARRTVGVNLTVEISTAKLVRDFGKGALTMDSYTKIGGRVKIMNIVKKKVVVKLNCTLTYNVSSMGIQRQDCKQHVNL